MKEIKLITKKQIDYILNLVKQHDIQYEFDEYIDEEYKPTDKLKNLPIWEASKLINRLKDWNICRVNVKDLLKNMSEEDIKYNCLLTDIILNDKVSKEEYTKERLITLWKELNNHFCSVCYYAFEGEFEWINCSLLEWMYDYLRIMTSGKSFLSEMIKHKTLYEVWEKDYFETTDIYNGKDEVFNKYLEDKIQFNEYLKNVIIEDNKLDDFIKSLTLDDICSYTQENTAYWKDLSCGDCLSLGVEIIFDF